MAENALPILASVTVATIHKENERFCVIYEKSKNMTTFVLLPFYSVLQKHEKIEQTLLAFLEY